MFKKTVQQGENAAGGLFNILLEIPPIEQDTAECIEDDYEKNPLHNTDGGVSADVVDTTSDLKSLITAHQGDDRCKEWRLP